MTNEKRNAAIMDKVERYTQHHTATPNLAQEAIERIAMTNDKDSAFYKSRVVSWAGGIKIMSWPGLSITANDGSVLLSITPDGTVEGTIENASEAARVFVENMRKHIAQPTQSDGEVAAAIRAALYKACPDMPNYPAGIVEPILAAFRQSTQSAERLEGYLVGLHDLKALTAEEDAFRASQPTQSDALRGAMELAIHENGPIVLDWMGDQLGWRALDGEDWTALQEQSK